MVNTMAFTIFESDSMLGKKTTTTTTKRDETKRQIHQSAIR